MVINVTNGILVFVPPGIFWNEATEQRYINRFIAFVNALILTGVLGQSLHITYPISLLVRITSGTLYYFILESDQVSFRKVIA
jgi:hypothetical protein